MGDGQEFGIRKLDALLAPVPEHAVILFENDPGVDVEAFGQQAAHAHLERGGRVVYAVTSRNPSRVRAAMREMGCDPDAHGDRFTFVDAHGPRMGIRESDARPVEAPGDATAFTRALTDAADATPDAMLVVDALSALVDFTGEDKFLDALPGLAAALRRYRFTVAAFTRWPYVDGVREAVHAEADAVVAVKGVETRVTFSQYFAVESASWLRDVPATPRTFKVARPGGVLVYVPKIVVTGPYDAGKSSFVHAVSDHAASADHMGTTVAMDHGRVTLDGVTTDVFGTPGQARFNPIIRNVAAQALGVILVVDATRPDDFTRAREILEITWKEGLPAIVAANKQDLPNALPPEAVARELHPPPGTPVVGCSGRDPEQARAVLKTLLDRILDGGMMP